MYNTELNEPQARALAGAWRATLSQIRGETTWVCPGQPDPRVAMMVSALSSIAAGALVQEAMAKFGVDQARAVTIAEKLLADDLSALEAAAAEQGWELYPDDIWVTDEPTPDDL